MSSETLLAELHPLPVDLTTYRARLPDSCDAAGSRAAAIRAFARAIAASPASSRFSDGIVVVRERPEPRVGILARLDDTDRRWLATAMGSLEGTVERLRFVDWTEVEGAAESVSSGLRSRLPEEVLGRVSLRGIPRGGIIAAGLVAYALDLPVPAAGDSPGSDGPLLVVDDCALTGARFRELLHEIPGREIIFAPLFSPPELRGAIEDSEERVLACVSGADLTDHAPRRLGEEYPEWRKRWRQRSGDAVYWVGQPDHLVFPWSEPEEAVWDEVRRAEAPALGVVPPELCMSRRAHGGARPDVRVLPDACGRLVPSAELLWGSLDGVTVIRDCERGRALTLEGTASAMWEALVAEGSPDRAALRLASSYDVATERVRDDLEAFLNGLLDRGILVDAGSDAESGVSEPVSSGDAGGAP